MPELKRSAFYDVQDQLGAAWTDLGKLRLGGRFLRDATAEHEATRNASNLWDESPLRKWDMKGPDALALADVLFTNDMAALEVGQVRYGAICDDDGQMIMDGTIFKLGDEHCFSITSYDSDLDWFRQVASDRGLNVEIEDVTRGHAPPPGARPEVPRDPRSPGGGPRTWVRCAISGSSRTPRSPGIDSLVSRTGYSGELGYELIASPRTRPISGTRCSMPASRRESHPPIGLSAIETLRIESGLLFPHRLLPAQDGPLRGAPRQDGQARQAGRLRRQGRAQAHRRGGDAAPAHHARARGRARRPSTGRR